MQVQHEATINALTGRKRRERGSSSLSAKVLGIAVAEPTQVRPDGELLLDVTAGLSAPHHPRRRGGGGLSDTVLHSASESMESAARVAQVRPVLAALHPELLSEVLSVLVRG